MKHFSRFVSIPNLIIIFILNKNLNLKRSKTQKYFNSIFEKGIHSRSP